MLKYRPEEFPRFFEFNHWLPCVHWTDDYKKECPCDLHIKGIHPSVQGIEVHQSAFEGKTYIPKTERFWRVLEKLEREVEMGIDGVPIRRIGTGVIEEIQRAIVRSQNCVLVKSPVHFKSSPEANILPSLTVEVRQILLMAEKLYFSTLKLRWGETEVLPFRHFDVVKAQRNITKKELTPQGVPRIKTLAQLAYEAASPLVWARQGLVISSSANLYDEGGKKLKTVMTTYCRPVRGLKEKFREKAHLFPKAIDIVTHLCNASGEIGLHAPELLLDRIISIMYLGTSSGINQSQKIIKTQHKGVQVVHNPNGKKYETLPAAMKQFEDFFLNGVRPFGSFKITYKEENYFMDKPDDKFRKMQKGRIFVIPDLIIILLEHVIGVTRKLELGGSIGIGRAWTKGGMDALLGSLGITDPSEWILNEGDVTKIDQSLADELINLFFSSRLQYFDPHHEDYPQAKKNYRIPY